MRVVNLVENITTLLPVINFDSSFFDILFSDIKEGILPLLHRLMDDDYIRI